MRTLDPPISSQVNEPVHHDTLLVIRPIVIENFNHCNNPFVIFFLSFFFFFRCRPSTCGGNALRSTTTIASTCHCLHYRQKTRSKISTRKYRVIPSLLPPGRHLRHVHPCLHVILPRSNSPPLKETSTRIHLMRTCTMLSTPSRSLGLVYLRTLPPVHPVT